MDPTGLPIGSGQGKVDVTATTVSTYTVTATSKSGGVFTISRDSASGLSRACTGASKGCNGGVW
jgi:hypothetical protein